MVQLHLYLTVGGLSPGCRANTEALLALDSCRPVKAQKHNGDWDRIVTPLQPKVWERALASHTDQEFVRYLCSGFREGFRIGFSYQVSACKPVRGNMKSASEHKDVVEQYLGMEREAKRVLGPLKPSDFPHVQVSSFGVIPKSEPGKWRLILDLSSPQGNSVNDGINRELCSLSYITVDDIATKVGEMGRGALMAKFDLKAAYRQIPVHPDDRCLLGMSWENELYIDTTLPFGLRSAPMIFSAVADGLAYIIREKGVKGLDHYLDDFSLISPPKSSECQMNLVTALETCDEVGFLVAPEKTEGPVTEINLLGIVIDSERLELRLPAEKLQKLRELVGTWRKRKACSKRELQSLAGHLNHACKVIRPGRRFLRGVFGLLSKFSRRDHMIRLNAAFRADMEWWHTFASAWNGVSVLRDLAGRAPGCEFWSDASGSWGCGAVWQDQWFQVQWGDWPCFAGSSIAAKELLPIVVAVAIWGPSWKGLSVLCHCDNQAVVAVLKGGYCKDPSLAHLLRCLFYLEAFFDITLSGKHVPGVENGAADSISRNNLPSFFTLTPQAQPQSCRVPENLVGRLVTNRPWTSDDWRAWLATLSTTH